MSRGLFHKTFSFIFYGHFAVNYGIFAFMSKFEVKIWPLLQIRNLRIRKRRGSPCWMVTNYTIVARCLDHLSNAFGTLEKFPYYISIFEWFLTIPNQKIVSRCRCLAFGAAVGLNGYGINFCTECYYKPGSCGPVHQGPILWNIFVLSDRARNYSSILMLNLRCT